jgi:PEGA domain
MMLDAAQHPAPGGQPQHQVVVPTMMRERPSGQLPPVRKPKKDSTWGRWVAGPLIAAGVAAGTAALANVVLPTKSKVEQSALKPQGHLRLQTEPPGASVTINGVNWSHFTPTVIDGDIGATLHVGFKLDGYATKEADVYVTEGEHPFSVKLEAQAKAPPPVEPATPTKEHHHHSSSSSTTATKPPEAVGDGSITIHVRPWAIVYVDGTRLRQTPVQDFKIKAGKHSIELFNEGKNRREKIQIQVKAGESQEISRDWDK